VSGCRPNVKPRQPITAWAKTVEIDEATMAPRRRLPFDDLYDQVRAFLQMIMTQRVFH
jgi:hypothetical protein